MSVKQLNKAKDSIHTEKNIMLVYQNCHLNVVLSMAKKAYKRKQAKNQEWEKMTKNIEIE